MKTELTQEEKECAEQLMWALKILQDQTEKIVDIGPNTYLRNSVGELTIPHIGEVQIQLALVKDKKEWIPEFGCNLTNYGAIYDEGEEQDVSLHNINPVTEA